RIADPNERISIEPLAVPFEPITLNEADRAFHALRSALEAAGERKNGPARARDDQSLLRIRIDSYLKHHGGWPNLLLALAFLVLIVLVTRRRPVFAIGMFGVGVSVAWSILRPRPGWRQRGRWFIVPAALVLRRPARSGRGLDVQVFPRRDSALCVSRSTTVVWKVRFAHDGRDYEIACSEAEANMLLRAWLSPREPPTIEKLTDLT